MQSASNIPQLNEHDLLWQANLSRSVREKISQKVALIQPRRDSLTPIEQRLLHRYDGLKESWYIYPDLEAIDPIEWSIDYEWKPIPYSFETREFLWNTWFRIHGYNPGIWKGFMVSGTKSGNTLCALHTLCDTWTGAQAWWALEKLAKENLNADCIYASFWRNNKACGFLSEKMKYKQIFGDIVGREVPQDLRKPLLIGANMEHIISWEKKLFIKKLT